ncbi:hypothetical protein [Amycolatopsis sp. NBC_01480]|uniref:hypothetical protein n=1 Tax=Amycolatopsis sp. NBC_01480 TaxID=2903562 RepID=UPI002E2A82D9|nr:hypothetical protein [Amycolatopsis sp. NBC_01480]
MPTDLRFAASLLLTPPAEWASATKTALDAGYDTVVTSDHPGMGSPFQTLAVAAGAGAATGTYLVDPSRWPPELLAREVDTAITLSGGRFELGLGVPQPSGPQAGPAAVAAALDAVEARIEPERRPRVLLAVFSDEDIPLAAERADVVSIVGADIVAGGGLHLHSRARIAEQIGRVRELAGRPMEVDLGVKQLVVTDDRAAAAAGLRPQAAPSLTEKELLDLPHALFGSVEEIAGQIRADARDLGFGRLSMHQAMVAGFTPVISALRGR